MQGRHEHHTLVVGWGNIKASRVVKAALKNFSSAPMGPLYLLYYAFLHGVAVPEGIYCRPQTARLKEHWFGADTAAPCRVKHSSLQNRSTLTTPCALAVLCTAQLEKSASI